jgi:ABC-type Co2+ transport system permease subunit
MKKVLLPIMIIAILIAFYEQSLEKKNVYISVVAIAVFMFGMMKLSAKTPSKNQDKEDDNVQ